jgi:hypothetical protein
MLKHVMEAIAVVDLRALRPRSTAPHRRCGPSYVEARRGSFPNALREIHGADGRPDIATQLIRRKYL